MIEILKKHFVSILLSSSIVISVLGVYTKSIIGILFLVIIVNSLIFYFLEYVKNNKENGLLHYFLVFIALIIIFISVLDFGTELTYFIRELKFSDISRSYFMLVFGWGCFGSSSVIFYFTNILHKFVAPFLLLFIPSILYTTHYIEIPIIYSALMVSLFFGNIILCKKNSFIKESQYISGTSYNFVLLVSIFIMFAIAFFVPKPKETPYNLIQNLQQQVMSSINLTDHFKSSSGNLGLDDKNPKILMTIKADEHLYLKRQVFGDYNGSLWSQPTEKYLTVGKLGLEKDVVDINMNVFIETIKRASKIDKKFAEKYNIATDDLPIAQIKTKTIELTHVDFPTTYIPHPLGITQIKGLPSGFDYYRNPLGEIITSSRVPSHQKYSISYSDIDTSPQIIEFLKKLDHDKYSVILYDLKDIFSNISDTKYYDISNLFLDELEKANYYKSQNTYKVPDNIKKLAENIIEGKTSDYEKALALESYFYENGYIYDLKYKAPPSKNNIEYFIFKSKTGTCSDYATAMTLMARSVGLNVRYVEGFSTGEPEANGIYTVTTKNSHAYPEVFLHGYGWKVFEPTVPTSDFDSETLKSKTTNFLGIVFILFILVFLIKKYIISIVKEIFFRKKIKSSTNEESIILIYSKILKMLVSYTNETYKSYTPQLLTKYILKNYNIDINIVADLFEKTAFDNYKVSNEEVYSTFVIYKNFYKVWSNTNRNSKL